MEIDTFERIDTTAIGDTYGTWVTTKTVGGDGSAGFINVPGLAGGLFTSVGTTYRAIPWTFGTVLRRSVPVIGRIMVLVDDGSERFEGITLDDTVLPAGTVAPFSRLDWEPVTD